MAEPSLQEREHDSMELIEDSDVVLRHDVKPDTAQIHRPSEEQDHLDESSTVYDKVKVSYSNLSIYDIYNPYLIGMKFWQAHSIALINSYIEFLKAWIDNIKLTASTCEEFNLNRNRILKITEL